MSATAHRMRFVADKLRERAWQSEANSRAQYAYGNSAFGEHYERRAEGLFEAAESLDRQANELEGAPCIVCGAPAPSHGDGCTCAPLFLWRRTEQGGEPCR